MSVLAGPVGLIAVVIGLVIAVGVWGKDTKPVTKSVEPILAQTKSASPAPQPTAPAPVETKPVETKPVETKPVETKPAEATNAALLAQRKHIDRSGGAAKTMLTTVYYADGLTNGASLQPVEVRIPYTDATVKAMAEQVIAAPTDLKLYSSVPVGTKVRSVDLDPATGVATVDLSAEASNIQGTEAVMNMRASFVYSLTSLKTVKAVQLWILGKPAMLHGIEWSQPLTRQQVEERSSYKVEPTIRFVP